MINTAPQEEMSVRDKLYQVLLEEIHAYSYMAETVKQKQDAIIRNDLRTLENLTGVERLLVKKVELLLQTRASYLQQLIKDTSSNPAIRLSAFIQSLPEDQQKRWLNLEQRIYRTVDKIRRLNMENQQLIRSSLNYIQGVVEMLYPTDENAAVYGKSGEPQATVAAKQIVNCNV